jgi:predicted hotdog family 3-hydroxylacyl-ACP dehydratase
MTPLGRDWLLAHLPQQGEMNLLDQVSWWSESAIRGMAERHRDPANPLRRGGELPIAAGIEYGAQLAAAHGALASGGISGAGFVASMRSVRFHARRLDDIAGSLQVEAEQLGGAQSGVIYRFSVSTAGRCLVEGRVAVAFAR